MKRPITKHLNEDVTFPLYLRVVIVRLLWADGPWLTLSVAPKYLPQSSLHHNVVITLSEFFTTNHESCEYIHRYNNNWIDYWQWFKSIHNIISDFITSKMKFSNHKHYVFSSSWNEFVLLMSVMQTLHVKKMYSFPY